MSQQNDKGSIALSPVFQKLNSPPSPRNKKFLVPALEGDRARVADHIIGSCANSEWSKLFLHPAEDVEPDEQPSTVDMSAFKGSPSTTKVPYSSSEPWSTSVDHDESESDSGDESDNESSGSGSDHGDDSGSVADGSASSSSSSDEDDSSGREGNSSDEECESNSNCSSSSSETGSSYSSCSRSESPVIQQQQTFSIRETNFDQGGLKLKISTNTTRVAEEPKSPPAKESTPTPPPAPQPQPVKAATPATSPEKKPIAQSPSISRLRPRKKEDSKGVAVGSTQQVQQRANGKRGQEPLTHAAGPSSARNGQPDAAISQLAQELSGGALQEINQEDLAAILPDVSASEGPNEDVAGPPFDGFEDVTTLGNKAEANAASTTNTAAASTASAASQDTADGESSSEDNDMLPNTVVSDAIQRIDVDDDNTSCTDGEKRSRTRADSYSSDDEDEGSDIDTKSARANKKMYSSRLLQQYEQNLLSQSDTQKSNSQSTGVSGETKGEQKQSKSPRHRRSRVKKQEAAEEAAGKSCSLELDSYIPLDCCNVSNVSPDSGIQSVAGSPVHQSCSPASNTAQASPHHTTSNFICAPKETSPHLTEPKKRRGRPAKEAAKEKGKEKKRGRPKKEKLESEASLTSIDTESPNCQVKRGPGRPKKSEEGVVKKSVVNGNKVKPEIVEPLPQKRVSKLSESKERQAKKTKERKDVDEEKNEKPRKGKAPKKKWRRQKNVKALTIPFPIKDAISDTLPISLVYKRSKSGRKHKKNLAFKSKNNLKKGHKFTHNKVQPKKKLLGKKSVKGVAFKKLKKKKKVKDGQPETKRDDPCFMTRLEELLISFNKCTISKSLNLPTPGENRLPSIFRVKKVLKRKKGSERVKNSDRESENDALPPKSPHSSSKEKSKRKTKKNAVEVPKRAEPNEQRLPLKKRHYHLPSQQQPITETSQDQPASSPTSASKASQLSSTQTSSTKTEKSSGNSKASRNSIDEAIESCISRFNPALSSKEDADSSKPDLKKKIKSEASVEKVPRSPVAPIALLSKRAAALKATNQITSTAASAPSNLEKEKEKEKKEPLVVKCEVQETDFDDVPLKDLINKKNKKKLRGFSKMPVVKLLDHNMILKKAVDAVKKKAKRRKAINRTGFPVKKKKKPKKLTDIESVASKVVEVKKENSLIELKDTRTRQKQESKDESPLPSKKSHKRRREVSVTDVSDSVPLSQRVAKRLKTAVKEDEPSTSAETPAEAEVPEPEGKGKTQPRWRKKYLVAGLFSDYYKEDEQRKTTPAELSKARNCVYKRDEHKHGLLPPPYHCGKFLRQRRVDFELPYDLWWQHQHNKLPGRDSEVPSWNYKKIRTNVYYDMKVPYMYEAHQACNCTLPVKTGQAGCGDDCINRLVYAECVSRLCPSKEKCSNQKIQKHEWSPGVEKFMTKEKGWGVRTKKQIKAGDFIMEYVGEVVSEREFKDRMESRYSNDTHHYCLHLDGGLVIDGHRMGGECRFVNHSCEPNCEMQKWSVNGLFRMALFALEDIDAGKELGYDYNFSLFNAAEGQPCKCGSINCRGVIGGKYQRVNPLVVDPKAAKKDGRKSRKTKLKRNGKMTDAQMRSQMFAPMKPMSHQQRCFAQEHHCFLLRNLEKLKRFREKLKKHAAEQQDAATAASKQTPAATKADVFLAQLNALSTPRSVRTRRLAQAEDNPELNKVARLAYVFKDIYQAVTIAKNDKGEQLCLPFMTLPSKKKASLYFERIQDAIDLTMIDKNITSGTYTTVENFDQDFCKLFSNNMVFYGRSSELGIITARLRKIYNEAKQNILPQLEDILGGMPPASFYSEKTPAANKSLPGKKSIVESEEDVIRCICGMFMDEGLMIQCERCLVWQHGDCVQADSSIEHYLCEQCNPRKVNRDIVMNPKPDYPEAGDETYYISLMREDLQLRIGDTVYVLRDIDRDDVEDPSLPPQKHTYKTLKNAKPEDCDIFKIERLFNEDGQRFAFGHHYLRPHETFHEPTRKFFPNEVMRIPLYEKVSFDLILDQCWVLDLPTYCKGRPMGAKEEHVYICEFRIDKTARLFTRLPNKTARQSACQFSMKSYAFESFESKLKPVRSYTPHPNDRPAPRPKSKVREDDASSCKMEGSKGSNKRLAAQLAALKIPPAVKRANQITRLNGVLLKLLDTQQCKQPLDVSYLLEPNKRQRKKPVPLQSS